MAPIAAAAAPAPVTPANLKAANNTASELAPLFVADKVTRQSAAEALASRVKNDGPAVFESTGFTNAILKALADKKSPAAREGAAQAITSLIKSGAIKALEPFIVTANEDGVFYQLLETLADKMPGSRNASLEAVRTIASNMSSWAVGTILPALLKQIRTAGKWQVKSGSLSVIDHLITSAPV